MSEIQKLWAYQPTTPPIIVTPANTARVNSLETAPTMPIEIMLPKLGFTMTEGTITEWLVADGQSVEQGQPLYALEAEKATQEIEAPASGVLAILVPAGEEVAVGVIIGTIE